MFRHRQATGFTLVEILIVVVILGILAAVVVPRFIGASDTASVGSLESQVSTVRGQLQVYKVEHQDQFPTLAQLWVNMTTKTNADGTTTGSPTLGPYLLKAPLNPLQASATVIAAGSTPDSTTGWVYDAATGDFKAAVTAAKATSLNLSTNDVVTY